MHTEFSWGQVGFYFLFSKGREQISEYKTELLELLENKNLNYLGFKLFVKLVLPKSFRTQKTLAKANKLKN